VARIGHEHLVASLGEHGLRLPQYAVLAALSDFGPLAPHVLAARLKIDRSHISSYVEALARRGWVRREPDPIDRRRHSVALTEAGAQLFDELNEAAARSQDRFLGVLTVHERRTLLALLTRVIVDNDRDAAPD
jgi:DNA-binding MarR family transcriptional regulator